MFKRFGLAAGVLAVVVVLISVSFLLKIKNLQVSTHDSLCFEPTDLTKIAPIKNQFILTIDEQSIKNKILAKYLCVKDVVFDKGFPNKLTVNIINKIAVAKLTVLSSDSLEEASPSSQSAFLTDLTNAVAKAPTGGTFLVDQNGLAFSMDKVGSNIPTMKIITNNFGVGRTILASDLQSMMTITARLKTFSLIPDQILIDNDSFILELNQPKIIAFNLKNDIEHQLTSLQLILEQNKMDSKAINIIDLRYDKPIVVYQTLKK